MEELQKDPCWNNIQKIKPTYIYISREILARDTAKYTHSGQYRKKSFMC